MDIKRSFFLLIFSILANKPNTLFANSLYPIQGMAFKLGGHIYATKAHLGYMFYLSTPYSNGRCFDLLVIRQGEQVDEHWGITLPTCYMESIIKYLED